MERGGRSSPRKPGEMKGKGKPTSPNLLLAIFLRKFSVNGQVRLEKSAPMTKRTRKGEVTNITPLAGTSTPLP